jgi:hypothetical protein
MLTLSRELKSETRLQVRSVSRDPKTKSETPNLKLQTPKHEAGCTREATLWGTSRFISCTSSVAVGAERSPSPAVYTKQPFHVDYNNMMITV